MIAMQIAPCGHIDTNVFKHAVKSDADFDQQNHPSHIKEWNKTQAHAVRCIIELTRHGDFTICKESEMIWEIGFTTDLAEAKRHNTLLAGIAMKKLDPPFTHSRIIGRTKEEATANLEEMLDFGIAHHSRMAEIYRATGADGKKADAYHIWTAEAAGVDFFISLDKKLINSIRHQNKITIKTEVLYPAEVVCRLVK